MRALVLRAGERKASRSLGDSASGSGARRWRADPRARRRRAAAAAPAALETTFELVIDEYDLGLDGVD
eukprot:8895684-Pyramimonas_sp.AAC.1